MNIDSLDLNLLRVLDALLREGSTVKAGKRIGLSQPAISAALGRLRHALGDDLFFRKGQGLEPTDFARNLAQPLHDALEGLQTLLDPPGIFDPTLSSACFRLSGSDFFSELLMPQLANELSRRAPGIKIQFIGLLPQMDIEAMDRHGIDIALIPTPDKNDQTGHRALMDCPFTVIARSGHPYIRQAGLKAGEVMPLDLLCNLGHVLFSNEGNLKATGDDALARIGRSRNVVMSMPYFSGVLRVVSESDLIALAPQPMAERFASKMGLQLFEPPMPVEPMQLSMIWPRRSTANPAHHWLRILICEILSSMNKL